MAHMSQERKAALAPAIKAVLAKYGMKGTIGVRHHSTLVVNVSEGALNVIGNYNAALAEKSRGKVGEPAYATTNLDVNPHWCHEQFTGQVQRFVSELVEVCDKGNHDRSDIQSDYFDVGWYVDVNIGRYDKPYRLLAAVKEAA